MAVPPQTNWASPINDQSEVELDRIGNSFITDSGFKPFMGNEKILMFHDDKLEENLKPAAQKLGLLRRVWSIH